MWAFSGRVARWWLHQMPIGPYNWCDMYSVFRCSVSLKRRNFRSIIFSHSSACNGSSTSLKIGGLVSRKFLKLLNWLGLGPWHWSLPRPWPAFYARPHNTSPMECWVSIRWAIISVGIGCGGGGRSSLPLPRPSLPPTSSPPAPLQVRVICKVATTSDY